MRQDTKWTFFEVFVFIAVYGLGILLIWWMWPVILQVIGLVADFIRWFVHSIPQAPSKIAELLERLREYLFG